MIAVVVAGGQDVATDGNKCSLHKVISRTGRRLQKGELSDHAI
jgi:hypothetical protein